MKFNFPVDSKRESINLSLLEVYTKKVRSLAQKHNCAITQVYETLITEAIEEYEEKFGQIEPKAPTPNYSHKRDVFTAGDGLRKKKRGRPKKVLNGGGHCKKQSSTRTSHIEAHRSTIVINKSEVRLLRVNRYRKNIWGLLQ
jgi:hypothetical protein